MSSPPSRSQSLEKEKTEWILGRVYRTVASPVCCSGRIKTDKVISRVASWRTLSLLPIKVRKNPSDKHADPGPDLFENQPPIQLETCGMS